MDRQNVTLALPVDLLKEARHLAVDRGLSLSGYLTTILEEHLQERKRYEEARKDALALMKKGWHLGTGGKATWTRDELHER